MNALDALPTLYRIVLLGALALLLSSCGVGGRGSGPTLGEIGDQRTLIDEPLAVQFTVGPDVDSVEAHASDSGTLLSGALTVEGSGATRTLMLQPGPLAQGEAPVTVTAAKNGRSGSETFRFEVVPPYRSVEQVIDVANDQDAGFFGRSTALEGSTLVVGAYTSSHAGQSNAGAVYVFELGDDGWQLSDKLTPRDSQVDHYFGYAVDVSGDLIIVGAEGDGEVDTGAGAAYIFERSGSGWSEVAKLLPRAGGRYQGFGDSLAIDGDLRW